jgi:phosphonopyruvate hydrolase
MAAHSKADQLRAKLDVKRPAIAMAAHNPLSAKLAAQAGFDAIWGSGFELSAAYAVPDASILPMGTHLEMMRAVAEAQDLPVVADIDTGFGNAVNVAWAVPRYAAAGVAAVVMEDQRFPKESSLRGEGAQQLIPLATYLGKLEAAKAGAGGALVIARTEALIAGLGQAEALKRGQAYVEAGADALLVHSKSATPDEILAFCHAWPGAAPLVIVPTSYPQLSFSQIGELGKVGMVICGNHAIRAAVAAMQSVFRRIREEGGIAGVEAEIAKVSEIFALQDDARMRAVEREFLR